MLWWNSNLYQNPIHNEVANDHHKNDRPSFYGCRLLCFSALNFRCQIPAKHRHLFQFQPCSCNHLLSVRLGPHPRSNTCQCCFHRSGIKNYSFRPTDRRMHQQLRWHLQVNTGIRHQSWAGLYFRERHHRKWLLFKQILSTAWAVLQKALWGWVQFRQNF